MQGHTYIIGTTLNKEKSHGSTLSQEYQIFVLFSIQKFMLLRKYSKMTSTNDEGLTGTRTKPSKTYDQVNEETTAKATK